MTHSCVLSDYVLIMDSLRLEKPSKIMEYNN